MIKPIMEVESKLTEEKKKKWAKILRNAADNIEKDKFTGVVAYSNMLKNKGKGNSFAVGYKGVAEDRLNVIDFMFEAVVSESEGPVKRFMVSELYKRFKHYFSSMYEAERIAKVNNDKGMVV